MPKTWVALKSVLTKGLCVAAAEACSCSRCASPCRKEQPWRQCTSWRLCYSTARPTGARHVDWSRFVLQLYFILSPLAYRVSRVGLAEWVLKVCNASVPTCEWGFVMTWYYKMFLETMSSCNNGRMAGWNAALVDVQRVIGVTDNYFRLSVIIISN